MRKIFFAFFLCLNAWPALSEEESIATDAIPVAIENSKLIEVFERYLSTVQMFDPERATRLGLHGADTFVTQRTLDRQNKQLSTFRSLRSKLREVNRDLLSPAVRADCDLLDRMLEADIYELANLNVLKLRPQYYLEPFLLIYSLMARNYDDYNVRAVNALSRLRKLPPLLQQARKNLTTPPKIWTEQAIKQAEALEAGVEEFLPAFKEYAGYDPALDAQVKETFAQVKAALADYRGFLQKNILPVSNGDFRSGDPAYEFYLNRWHALDMSPGAALGYSKGAFKRARKNLEKEARRADAALFKAKGWKAVLDKMPKKHPPADGVLKAFQDEMNRLYRRFYEHKTVSFPKRSPVIMRMPVFAAAILPYVQYFPPFAYDDSGLAELMVALPSADLPAESRERVLQEGFNYSQLELLSASTLLPGLHLLNWEANLNPSRIRRLSNQPMLVSGWAAYSELLTEELGYYSSSWTRLLRAYMAAVRAARAYVDVSLHRKKMTEKEAVDFFRDNLYFSEAQSRGEVLRLSLSPTQALGPVLGLARILEMRDHFPGTGQKYSDLRKFHDSLLKEGKIPLAGLESFIPR